MNYIVEKRKDVRFVQGKDNMKLEMKNKHEAINDILGYCISFCKEVEKIVE